ncbi:uncharacterized protein LOC126819417 [Patella vulgata]|uniref:uncharacterized protein LOC126819417 n=1 Tax=Patella vulgata TaxID=6465 RepID=UPI00218007C3|nr:uncharacterized protein LOC126819417 [Patella vulgata]
MASKKAEASPLMFRSHDEIEEDSIKPEQELANAVSRKKRKRRTSLIINDSIIVILEFFQIWALIQSMSLKWTYPFSWLQSTNFIFFVNLDFWEFVKVNSGAFKGIQNYNPPSSDVPFSYNYVLLAMGLLLFLIAAILLIIYAVLRYRKRPFLFVHVARMSRALTIACQVLTLPIGVVIFRLFHCNTIGEVDVLNEMKCFEGLHWLYIVLAVFIMVALFLVFPAWMIYRIRREVLASTVDHHESYLQLKEMEYMSGLDVVWVVKGFHLFSSFNLRAIWYRPIMQIFKLTLLVVYTAAFSHIFAQAIATASVLFVFWLLILILRPFRLTSFNVLLGFGYLCLIGDAVFGSSIASYKPSQVASPWLVQPYDSYVLTFVNSLMVFSCLVFIIHLTVYQICCYQKYGYDPLWPSMASRNNCQISKETKKFMYAVLQGRAVLEKCRTMAALFTPIHELTQQIQIINAYLREAEKLQDGFHDTLWDLLDEMIDAHHQLEPKSLFSDNVKESIRNNAAEFLKLMPMFSRRLAQRDYDYILVSPLKKRLLLKMNIIGMFLYGRKEKMARHKMVYPEIQKIWPKSLLKKKNDKDGEYCEDLYPERLLGPDAEEMFESSSLYLPLELMELDEDEETESISTLLRPSSAHTDLRSLSNSVVSLRSGKFNPAFESDENQTDKQTLILTDMEIGESSDDIPQQHPYQPDLICLSDEPKMAELISLVDETTEDNNINNFEVSTLSIHGADVGDTTTENVSSGIDEEKTDILKSEQIEPKSITSHRKGMGTKMKKK